MITIYSPEGTPIMVVQERDESRYTHSLMGEHSVRLRFDWTEGVPLPYHSYIEYADRRWHLFASYIPTQRDGVAEYDVAFHAPEAELANFTAFYLSQGAMEAEWHLTGTLEQFAREIEANLRRINSSLTIDPKRYATEREARYISVEKMTISDLVAKVAEDFSLDWWIEGSELRFGQMPRKEEITARLGELAGAFTPSGEGNPLISRLYAFGSTRNLTNKYRQSQEAISRIAEVRLHLPEAKPYVQGVTNGIEQVEYFEDVYPRYVGRVSAVSTRQSGADTIYKISDTALHIKPKYLLEGQTLRLQFESGALRGMEFDLAITSDGYEIVPNESYGQRLPSGNLVPSVGDEYVPFGFDISMVGDEYVPRAEQELLTKATEWLQANNEDRRDVEVTCNPVWVYERGTTLSLGQAMRLVDAIPTGDKVGRITRLEYPLYCPQALTLTVGNTRPMNRIETLRAEAQHKADEAKAFAERKQREAQQYTERRFVQAEETMQGLLATLGDRYGGEINPVAVKTMQLLAGDERLQFVFVESLSDRTPKALGVDYRSNSRTLRIAQPATLMHYTLPNGRTLSTGDTSRLRLWTLPAYQSPTLSEADKPYYLYALVAKAEGNSGGHFLVSDVRVEDTASEYALLVGMASSEDSDGGRSFVSLHGFSEILPGRITTDRIVSVDGGTYFDLQRGEIGGNIKFRGGKDATTFVRELIQEDKLETKMLIDATALNENKYYPLFFKLRRPQSGSVGSCRIIVERSLSRNLGVPTYSAHAIGFTIYLEWIVTASQCGVSHVDRRIVRYQSRFLKSGEYAISKPNQDERVSEEYVYVRGGSKYYVTIDGAKDVPVELYPNGHSIERLGITQEYSVLDSISDRLPKTDITESQEYSVNEATRKSEEAKAYAREQDNSLRAGITAELATKLSAIDNKHADLQRQIDGQTVRWFGDTFPPNKLWKDADDKHNGDTYTVVPPNGVTISSDNAHNYPDVGKSWRWHNSGWVPIADSDTTRALALASNAQAAADGKVTHFVSTTIPIDYRKGDLWTLPTAWNGFKAGSILVASANAVAGQVNLNHWRESNRYTDDSRLDALRVGSRNLVLNSNVISDHTKYLIASYTMAEPWQVNETYSVSVWGEVYGVPTGYLGENPPTIGIYTDGGSRSIGRARLSVPTQMINGAFRGVWTLTGTFTEAMAQSPSAGNGKRLALYLLGNQDNSIRSVINKIIVVKGNRPPVDWQPAPEDISQEATIDKFVRDMAIVDTMRNALIVEASTLLAGNTLSSVSERNLISSRISSEQGVYTNLKSEIDKMQVGTSRNIALATSLYTNWGVAYKLLQESIAGGYKEISNTTNALLATTRRDLDRAMSVANSAKGIADRAVTEAQLDGAITDTEAKAIAEAYKTYRKGVESEWAILSKSYEYAYRNEYLSEENKPILVRIHNEAQASYNTLISRITSIVSDGQTDASEIEVFESDANIYKAKITALIQALEEANEAIQNDLLKRAGDDASTKTREAEYRAKAYVDTQVKRVVDEDYLRRVIKDGSTTINGGLVLTNIVCATDANSKIRSFISGDLSKPALAAGLDDSISNPKAYIDHQGNARFGNAHIDAATGQYSFIGKGGEQYMRIGGTLTPLNDLMMSSGFSAVHQVDLEILHSEQTPLATKEMSIPIARDNSSIILNLRHIILDSTIDVNRADGTMYVMLYSPSGDMLYSHTTSAGDRRTIEQTSKHLFGLPAGTYRLVMETERMPSRDVTFGLEGTASVKWVGDIKEIALGEDGLSLFYGQDRMLYAHRTGDPFLTLRGKVMLNGYPLGTVGVLSCGVARKSGNSYVLEYSGGLKPVTLIRISGKTLILSHNIGHTNYTITATNNVGHDILQVVSRNSSSTIIKFVYPVGGNMVLPENFDFQIIGDIK